MKIKLISVCFLIIFQSCNNSEKSDISIIQDFKNIPEDIDGCGCYFKRINNYESKIEEFIFINDLANLAFVKIENKIVSLELVSNKENYFLYKPKQEANISLEVFVESNIEGISTGYINTKYNDLSEKISFKGDCGC